MLYFKIGLGLAVAVFAYFLFHKFTTFYEDHGNMQAQIERLESEAVTYQNTIKAFETKALKDKAAIDTAQKIIDQKTKDVDAARNQLEALKVQDVEVKKFGDIIVPDAVYDWLRQGSGAGANQPQ